MKTVLTLIIGLVVGTLGLSSTAEAGSLRIGYSTYITSGHHSCGCAIHTKKVYAGRARCGTPIFRYYTVPNKHRCQHLRTQGSSHYQRGYDRSQRSSRYHRGNDRRRSYSSRSSGRTSSRTRS
ncbi:hypothetical protein N9165_00990 [Akkermansiaceae bacterium]|nr:hypothetical protein [Akkermansiaceae bacterium]